MMKLPSDDELRDAFWTGYAAASWGEKEVSGMRACAALAIARMNERATPPAMHEAARMALDAIVRHWDEFGPADGFDEVVDQARRTLIALRAAIDAARRDGGE